MSSPPVAITARKIITFNTRATLVEKWGDARCNLSPAVSGGMRGANV